jgi:hypothetical protein
MSVTDIRRQRLAISVEAHLSRFHLKKEAESSSREISYLNRSEDNG